MTSRRWCSARASIPPPARSSSSTIAASDRTTCCGTPRASWGRCTWASRRIFELPPSATIALTPRKKAAAKRAKRPAAPLTGQAEDYLKAIYELEQGGGAAGTNDIAARLGIAAASVTGMVQRLVRLGLVRSERYRGARLTAAGRSAALQLIRRHRIIESYLVERLGFGWEDVHDEAERLEHAASDDLIARMAEAIGNPTADPHGAPIPTESGEVDETRLQSIADLAEGAVAAVVRMSDRDPEFLRYLDGLGIRPGASVRVLERAPFAGPVTLEVDGVRHAIGTSAAAMVYIRRNRR
ncbi:MAG: metal-dependent transcriptional regulator [Gemmatimonadetes bacterium]|nr:metal-dependent transcriptional regulator [Gemmatimonadota bacterium]